MEFLHLLWTILSFVLGLVWQVAWFLLRDLISTALWLLIAAWAFLSIRYRSFSLGALALTRFGGYGFRLLWRWARGGPGHLPPPPREKPPRVALSATASASAPFQSPRNSICCWSAPSSCSSSPDSNQGRRKL